MSVTRCLTVALAVSLLTPPLQVRAGPTEPSPREQITGRGAQASSDQESTAMIPPAQEPATSPGTAADRVAVLPVRVEGELTADDARALERRITDGLRRGRFEVVDPAEVTAAVPSAASCSEPACLQQIASATGATHVLKPTVSLASRNYAVKLELVRADGELVTANEETCEICGLSEAGELVADQAAALRNKIDLLTRPPSPVTITVTSEPSGADVVVDGEVIGQTPLERALGPGEHLVTVRKDGYAAAERRLELKDGVNQSLSFQLARAATEKRRRRKDIWGWVGIGSGVAVLAGGITLLVLDEQPYRRDCSGNNIDENQVCRFRYNTLGGGIAMTIAGVALVTTGAVLVALERRGNRSRVRAGLFPTGLVLTGAF